MGRYNVIEPESRDFLRPLELIFLTAKISVVTDAADDVFSVAKEHHLPI
jgi:hypothetical protein